MSGINRQVRCYASTIIHYTVRKGLGLYGKMFLLSTVDLQTAKPMYLADCLYFLGKKWLYEPTLAIMKSAAFTKICLFMMLHNVQYGSHDWRFVFSTRNCTVWCHFYFRVSSTFTVVVRRHAEHILTVTSCSANCLRRFSSLGCFNMNNHEILWTMSTLTFLIPWVKLTGKKRKP